MRLLDLFCGAGGAGAGYRSAGFDVVGVDLAPQPRYPFHFVQADALAFLSSADLSNFDAIHASPPCQRYSRARSIQGNEDIHPDLVGPTREALQATGLPYVIENVVGAPLHDPVTVCGTAFALRHDGFELRRHRLFESNVPLVGTVCRHELPAAPVFGHGAGANFRRRHGRGFESSDKAAIMGISWATRDEVSEAIPPVFAAYIGAQVLAFLFAAAGSHRNLTAAHDSYSVAV